MKIERDERRFDFHDIGLAIKRAREASGMTQEQLAYIVDRSPRTIYKNVIFDTKPVAGKVYKNSENRTFLAVFAVFVVIRLAPSDPTRSVADTVDVAPVRLAQGIIK